jgi:DNA polymerase III subunit delta
VILKSYIVEQNIEILKNYQATLIYGQNGGIKDDVKQQIKNQNKNIEIINFFEADILKSDRLYENFSNQSLFAQKKIIFIHEVTDKILEKVQECLGIKNNDIEICLFSGNLEKKSKLRSFFEKGKKLAIFPCYEDNERTLITYINKELKGYKGLTGDIVNLIISNSNLDRRVIRNEINKIKNFFIIEKVNKDQILEILNLKNESDFNEIRDKALMGEKLKINKLLSETEILNDEAFFYLNSFNFRILRLHEIVKIKENNNNNFEEILANSKPPIFWKDKPIIIEQLKKWSLKKLEDTILKIGETEILMKKNSYLRNDIVIKELIISLTNKASISY